MLLNGKNFFVSIKATSLLHVHFAIQRPGNKGRKRVKRSNNANRITSPACRTSGWACQTSAPVMRGGSIQLPGGFTSQTRKTKWHVRDAGAASLPVRGWCLLGRHVNGTLYNWTSGLVHLSDLVLVQTTGNLNIYIYENRNNLRIISECTLLIILHVQKV